MKLYKDNEGGVTLQMTAAQLDRIFERLMAFVGSRHSADVAELARVLGKSIVIAPPEPPKPAPVLSDKVAALIRRERAVPLAPRLVPNNTEDAVLLMEHHVESARASIVSPAYPISTDIALARIAAVALAALDKED